MRGRRLKPTRVKVLTGNPGKRPLNQFEPRPAGNPGLSSPTWRSCAEGMESSRRGACSAEADDQFGPCRSCRLLRRVCALGRCHGGHSEIWRHGQIAHGISCSVAVRRNCKQAGRNHDADRVRVWIHPGQPKSDFNVFDLRADAV
jgi:hypothetical protein